MISGFIAIFITLNMCAQPEGINPDYLHTLNSRAEKIVGSMDIRDPGKAGRVQELIVNQYYDLSRIHDKRDSLLQGVSGQELDKRQMAEQNIRTQVDAELYRLHASFLAGLSANLTPEQVDQVKDGMTYGVLERTYNAYLELLPGLTDEQKRFIYKNLFEAREFAMDAGSSDEKHGWFGKYKGKINNYLSGEGYDLKKAEEELKSGNKN